jgi:hypothetical protein
MGGGTLTGAAQTNCPLVNIYSRGTCQINCMASGLIALIGLSSRFSVEQDFNFHFYINIRKLGPTPHRVIEAVDLHARSWPSRLNTPTAIGSPGYGICLTFFYSNWKLFL